MTTLAKTFQSKDAKRARRTGLQYGYFQPRPDRRAYKDCAVRAACWATGEDYEAILDDMLARVEAIMRRPVSILKTGTPLTAIRDFFCKRGWTWSKVTGRLFKAENLPKCLCVVITTSHAVAVEDHVVLDSYDSRGDRSCTLKGYFVKKS